MARHVDEAKDSWGWEKTSANKGWARDGGSLPLVLLLIHTGWEGKNNRFYGPSTSFSLQPNSVFGIPLLGRRDRDPARIWGGGGHRARPIFGSFILRPARRRLADLTFGRGELFRAPT